MKFLAVPLIALASLSVLAVSAHAGTWSASPNNSTLTEFTMIAPLFSSTSTGTNIDAGHGAGISLHFSYDWNPGFAGDASPSMIAEHKYDHGTAHVNSSISPLSTNAFVRTLTEPSCTLWSYQSYDVANYYGNCRAEATLDKFTAMDDLAPADKTAQIIIRANQDYAEFYAVAGINNGGEGNSDVSAHSDSTGLTLNSTGVRFFAY